MTGTQNHEGLAGVVAAIDYLASLGNDAPTRRQRLLSALEKIAAHESALVRQLLECLATQGRFRVWGITRPDDLAWRAPTLALTAADRTPAELAEHLGRQEIYAWNGNMYGLELTERLGLEASGGILRLGLVHYNTPAEVDQTLEALDRA
jgi:selenocysteine lyase/cysteine desulfurase